MVDLTKIVSHLHPESPMPPKGISYTPSCMKLSLRTTVPLWVSRRTEAGGQCQRVAYKWKLAPGQRCSQDKKNKGLYAHLSFVASLSVKT